jgi:hypothetical protein
MTAERLGEYQIHSDALQGIEQVNFVDGKM